MTIKPITFKAEAQKVLDDIATKERKELEYNTRMRAILAAMLAKSGVELKAEE
jgi:hypothetical protein